jgi:hypothetical protein
MWVYTASALTSANRIRTFGLAALPVPRADVAAVQMHIAMVTAKSTANPFETAMAKMQNRKKPRVDSIVLFHQVNEGF